MRHTDVGRVGADQGRQLVELGSLEVEIDILLAGDNRTSESRDGESKEGKESGLHFG